MAEICNFGVVYSVEIYRNKSRERETNCCEITAEAIVADNKISTNYAGYCSPSSTVAACYSRHNGNNSVALSIFVVLLNMFLCLKFI